MTTRLLIATNNKGKRREIQAILGPTHLDVELVLPADVGLHLDVDETGSTYAENAALKAEAFCRLSGLLTLADDSGLEVETLGNEPGIRSARYAPWPGATDADRRHYLLEKLTASGAPRPWAARFRCTIALAAPGRPLKYAEGVCPGQIISEERGSNGFGYDPIFWMPELGCTMAELSEEHKNQLSHRARALAAALPVLEMLIEKAGKRE